MSAPETASPSSSGQPLTSPEDDSCAGEAARRDAVSYRLLVEHAADAISLHTPDGTYRYASPACRDLLGYAPDVLVGQSIYPLCLPEDAPKLRRSFQALTRSSKTQKSTYRFQRRSGGFVWLEITIKGIWQGDAIEGVVVVSREVTGRIDPPAQIEAKRRGEAPREIAKARDRIKSSLLANMNHEIRTPLTAILGFTDLLRNMVDGKPAELIEAIRSSGERLQDTLTAVLELVELEGNARTFELEAVNVRREVEDVLRLFEPKAREKGIALCTHVPEEAVNVQVDRAALHRVLTHLVDNAVKFTETGHVAVRVTPHSEAVAIAVEDTGIGIDPAFVPYLFEAFTQESEGIDRHYQGVGLGLAIARQLVERMRGTIEVTGTRDDGTTFTVYLPPAQPL